MSLPFSVGTGQREELDARTGEKHQEDERAYHMIGTRNVRCVVPKGLNGFVWTELDAGLHVCEEPM